VGNTVASLIGPITAGLLPGAETLVAEGDFASVTNPFRYREDLAVRTVPLERLAQEVRPDHHMETRPPATSGGLDDPVSDQSSRRM